MAGGLLPNLPVDAYIALRYVSANLRQSLIIMMAVGIGVALIIFIPSINLSFFQHFLDQTIENNAHITLTRELETMPRNRQVVNRTLKGQGERAQVLYSDQTQTRRRNITAYRRLITELEQFPGVTAVAPHIKQQVIVVRGSQNRGASLTGIIPDRETQVSNIEEDVEEGNLQALGPNEVFLGSELAAELGVGMGDRVQVLTAYGTRSYKVSGLLKSGVYQQDLTSLYMQLNAAQRLLDMPNEVTAIGVKIEQIYEAERIARQMASLYSMKARSWMEDNKIFLDQIGNFRIIIGVINFLIVFAAATSITSILIMVVASKSREIGILKAMGAKPNTIMRLFVSQGMFLSILGFVSGLAGAWFLITLYNASPMAKGETLLGIERPPTVMSQDYAVLAFIYSMICSMLASLFPAWRASRLDPVTAINQ